MFKTRIMTLKLSREDTRKYSALRLTFFGDSEEKRKSIVYIAGRNDAFIKKSI